MHRRTFVKTIAQRGVALTAGACLWPPLFNGCTTVKWVPGETMEGGIGVSLDQLLEQKFFILNNPSLGGPVGISLDKKGEITAVLLICTHKQCGLQPVGMRFDCSCHGSQFSRTGEVLSPPASEPLKKLKFIKTEKHLIFLAPAISKGDFQ